METQRVSIKTEEDRKKSVFGSRGTTASIPLPVLSGK